MGAEASVEKIVVAFEKSIDANTGELTYLTANPSGEVDVKFLISGLEIGFTDKAGQARQLRIFFSASDLIDVVSPDASDGETTSLIKKYEATGFRRARELLQALSGHLKKHGFPALLHFESGRSLGFVTRDFEASSVLVLTKEGSLTMREAVFGSIVSEARHAKKAKSRGVGFTAESFTTLPVCRDLFQKL